MTRQWMTPSYADVLSPVPPRQVCSVSPPAILTWRNKQRRLLRNTNNARHSLVTTQGCSGADEQLKSIQLKTMSRLFAGLETQSSRSEGWSRHLSSSPRHVSQCLSLASLFINPDLLFIQKNSLLNYIFNTEAQGRVECSPPLSGVNDINMSSQSLSSLSNTWQTSSLHLDILLLCLSLLFSSNKVSGFSRNKSALFSQESIKWARAGDRSVTTGRWAVSTVRGTRHFQDKVEIFWQNRSPARGTVYLLDSFPVLHTWDRSTNRLPTVFCSTTLNQVDRIDNLCHISSFQAESFQVKNIKK